MSKKRHGSVTNRRVFVYAGLDCEQIFHVEAETANDAEGALSTLLQSASKWATGLSPEVTPTPAPPLRKTFPLLPGLLEAVPPVAAGSASLPALSDADAIKSFNKDEKDYYGLQGSEERSKITEALRQLRGSETFATPLRFRVLQSALPLELKRRVLCKLEKHQEALSAGDIVKYQTWVEGLLSLPLEKLVVPKEEPGAAQLRATLEDARRHLDAVVYGHRSAKQAILERLYLWLRHPFVPQRPLALHGPAGTGKTMLVRAGLSVVMGRPFSLVALGGSSDASTLLGHGFTYEGSVCGRIAESLITAKCLNPVILFDELDKISSTAKGDEVVNAFIHLCDTSQNAVFRDRYFAGVDLDVSKALFVFAFNDCSKVSPVLLDRLQVVQTDAFDARQQATILRDFLLPRILADRGLAPDFLSLAPELLREAALACCAGGVRLLQSVLEQAVSKVCLFRETADGDLIYPLKRSDFVQLAAGRYELRGGLVLLLEASRSGEDRAPPASMYS
jgi:ATP-dependent Lon protease